MKKYIYLLPMLSLFLAFGGTLARAGIYTLPSNTMEKMPIKERQTLVFKQNGRGWFLEIAAGENTTVRQDTPLVAEFMDSTDNSIKEISGDYYNVTMNPDTFEQTCEGVINYRGAFVAFKDIYSVKDGFVTIKRYVRVTGSLPLGFATSFGLKTPKAVAKDGVRYFVPGNIYGGIENLPENAFGKNPDAKQILIREDRLPAPMFGSYFPDKSSITILNLAPDGNTSARDGATLAPTAFIDAKIRTGSIGVKHEADGYWVGYRFPLAEGDISYGERVRPSWNKREMKWNRRFHPVEDGFTQTYTIAYRFDENQTFPEYYNTAWRWAWNCHNPQINFHNIDDVKKYSVGVLSQNVQTNADASKYGIINAVFLRVPNPEARKYKPSIMGFTGKALETANFLIRHAGEPNNPDAALHRKQGYGLINTFLALKMNPPEAEGFDMLTWEPAYAFRNSPRIFLRSFTDDLKATLRAYTYEKSQGRDNPAWLAWVRGFCDWLLTQQYENGGFPRTFERGTGKIIDPSAQTSYLPVPLLLMMTKITGDEKYARAAERGAEYSWRTQAEGEFTGGTIDNPNAIDKEAGTLSLEAYLMLHDKTNDRKWLDRAIAAANYVATWMYIWNVPMPEDAQQKDIEWMKGTPTVGLQLISTGHSLADYYCCFDVDEFARLYQITGDAYYKKIAQILLHNTCNMMSLPGQKITSRLPEYSGYGWQQEHWCLAPLRGVGNKSLWLPWVTTSHLNGIYGLEDLGAEIAKEIKGK